MNIWRITEDKSVYHHVIATDKRQAISIVTRTHGALFEELEAQVEPLDKVLKIEVDGYKKPIAIRHTCEEWLGIYNHEPQYLCCSEW